MGTETGNATEISHGYEVTAPVQIVSKFIVLLVQEKEKSKLAQHFQVWSMQESSALHSGQKIKCAFTSESTNDMLVKDKKKNQNIQNIFLQSYIFRITGSNPL